MELAEMKSLMVTIVNNQNMNHDQINQPTNMTDAGESRGGKSKEHTSSGKSVLHFRHFKASLSNQTLCQMDKWFIELSLSTG
jgi:hypothetical protein